MSNLAEQFKQAGIEVNDVVEMASSDNWLTTIISEPTDTPPSSREGELVEVTAIGDKIVCGYWLEGSGGEGYSYVEHQWLRKGDECMFSGQRIYFRKVGRGKDGSYEWLHPEMTNIYSRCQKGIR